MRARGAALSPVAALAGALFLASLGRESRAGRGESLRLLGRGRVADPRVRLASARGFGVGLVCGAVMTLAVPLLPAAAGVAALARLAGRGRAAHDEASPRPHAEEGQTA